MAVDKDIVGVYDTFEIPTQQLDFPPRAMLPVLRVLASAAARGEMSPKELQLFYVLVAGGALGALAVLRTSTKGVRGLLKSLAIVAVAHATRRAAYRLLAAAFPATFEAAGLPAQLDCGQTRDSLVSKSVEHTFSLQVLDCCLDLALKLNYRGVKCMQLQWAIAMRDEPSANPVTDLMEPNPTPKSMDQDGSRSAATPPQRLESLLHELTDFSVASVSSGPQEKNALLLTPGPHTHRADSVVSSSPPYSHGSRSRIPKWASPVRPVRHPAADDLLCVTPCGDGDAQ